MKVFSTEEVVLHYRPNSNGFFQGRSGYQILWRVYRLFGVRVWRKPLDSETVPHYHYVQQATLGLSEWRSRILQERGANQ